MPTPHTFCMWCWRKVHAPKGYDPKKEKPIYCGVGCRDAAGFFLAIYHDDNIPRFNVSWQRYAKKGKL